MNGKSAGNGERLRWAAKKLAFSVLRARQPVQLFDGRQSASGLSLRVLHVGDPFRGRYFIERLYGCYPECRLIGQSLIGPSPRLVSTPSVEYDVRLIEINRLFIEAFRRAGYFVIPEWVEFGRAVVDNEDSRYAGASKSLRTDLRAIRRSGFEVSISRESTDFERFYETMYQPYIAARFGQRLIAKSRRKLRKDFRAGFLMFLKQGGTAVAGAVVRVDAPTVNLTTLGVLNGSESLLKSYVSGALDYYLHAWAAGHGMRHIRVGHTRPFPGDGVFFNKRKWQMTISPDHDGVMNVALKGVGPERAMIDVLEGNPFVYQGRLGLGVLCVHVVDRRIDANEARSLLKRYWTEGLSSFIAICPRGWEPGVVEQMRDWRGPNVHMCDSLKSAVDVYRNQV